MKYAIILFASLVFLACSEKKKTQSVSEPERSVLDSLAMAYGFEAWSGVKKIAFTFNASRAGSHYARRWIWDTRNNEVISVIDGDSIRYNRKAVDSTNMAVDARFINDKYWLLVPFNLIWDQQNFSYTVGKTMPEGSAENAMRKLTIVYGDKGGYTPGDAYDFYFDHNYRIKSWKWRKGNDTITGVETLWSEPKSHRGIFISTAHSGIGNDLRIYFTDIQVDYRLK